MKLPDDGVRGFCPGKFVSGCSQLGPSGLNIVATVLGSQPSASTESQLLSVASQGANPTSGELLCEKNGVGVGIFHILKSLALCGECSKRLILLAADLEGQKWNLSIASSMEQAVSGLYKCCEHQSSLLQAAMHKQFSDMISSAKHY